MKRLLKAFGIVIIILFICVLTIMGVNRYFASQKNLAENKKAETNWNERDGKAYIDLSYGDGERNTYHMFIPTGLEKEQTQQVMLFIHGGAWTSGDKEDMQSFCEKFAKKGYITASMNYSYLSNVEPLVTAETMISEVGACIQAIKNKVEEEGYSVDGIALSGQSAGAHLAMMYAYGHAGESVIPIRFVFQQVGPSDFHKDTWGVDTDMQTMLHTGSALAGGISGLSGRSITAKQLRNEDSASEEAIALISPAALVTEQTVPTIMAYGEMDTVVGTKQGDVLQERFEANGVDYRYILYPNSGHSLNKDKDCRKEFYQAVDEFTEKYF